MSRTITTLLLALSAGCETVKPSEYDDVNGTYEGPMSGSAHGIAITATSTVTITQTDGDLSASWYVTGTMTIFGEPYPLDVSEEIRGTLAKGRDPAVSFTMPKDEVCPDLPSWEATGRHLSEERVFELKGGIPFIDTETCGKDGEIPVTLEMTKK